MDLILSNRYVLTEVIGTGGMAVVYRAWDRVQLREVAVKVLRSEFNTDDEFVRRFHNEAHAASQMAHPNIVNMYDVGLDGNMRYIVMEYVKGQTLKDVIRKTGRIKQGSAVRMTLRILAAVDHAHKNHIVHRDIKPQNILVDNEGHVKVADFGIARATNTNSYTQQNEGDSVLGSVHYFSPEQASGQVADEKSDLYSVGVVLYEMVTGQVPFDGDSAVAVALKHVQERPRSTRLFDPSISKGLDEVIMKSLEKDAEKRYQTAAEMAGDLRRAMDFPKGGFVNTVTLTPAEVAQIRQERRESRKKLLKRGVNYAVFAAVVALVVILFINGSELYRRMFARINLPNVVRLNVEQAVEDLKGLGLTYTIDEQHYDDVNYGIVISQSPKAGTQMWEGERVQLLVSTGKEKVMMPKLLEATYSEAVKLIEQSDLILRDVSLVISDAPVGDVVQQVPAVNEWVKPGDPVDLSVSGASAIMPTVLGLTLEEGKEKLIASGFTVNPVVIEKLSPEEEGTIVEQSIEAGVLALLGKPIQLTISQVRLSSYRTQKKFVIAIPEGGAEVKCTVEENAQESEQYRHYYEKAGNQSITLDLDAQSPGLHKVRMYVNDILNVEYDIEFG